MNPLLDNPVANMYGPTFLAFYGTLALFTILACSWFRRAADTSRNGPPLELGRDPDPIEIAFLRGGANEVTRLVIFDLVQRGFLRLVQPPQKWFRTTEPFVERHPEAPPPRLLKPVEQAVLNYFTARHSAKEVFESPGLPSQIERLCADYDVRFREQGFLSAAAVRAAAWKAGLTGAAIILGLGTYKLVVALMKEHYNVAFLIALGILATIALAIVCHVPKLSARGRDYLARLQHVFARLKEDKNRFGLLGPDPRLLLLVSLFGVSTLEGTTHDAYRRMFVQSSSGGCGGGCGGGGGGCGGGGCGGGCGGCGG